MNLHEYQARDLLKQYGVAVPEGGVASTAEEAVDAAKTLGGDLWVVKAQAHTGGRGKGGGVKLARTLEEVETHAKAMLGMTLVTHQTGPEGLPVSQVLISAGADIDQELYLSALVDREQECVVMMASTEGGMDIEEVAANTPDKIFSVAIHPATGLLPCHARELAYGLGLDKAQQKTFFTMVSGLYRMIMERDTGLVEINPLAIQENGELIALDIKINIEDNALFRHGDLLKWRDITQEDAMEAKAHEHELNYVSLDGDIACMVNGAGLAMATMDLIKLHGGEPANFLDVGGGATTERVCEAFKLILSNDKVKAILVNIFGGIVRCDWIADGVIQAVQDIGVDVPVVVRLEGTNVDIAKAKLKESGLEITAADDLTDAAKKVVAAAGGAS